MPDPQENTTEPTDPATNEPLARDAGIAPSPLRDALPGAPAGDDAEGDGPRERMARLGPSALSNAELLAVVLGVGRKGHPVADVAADLSARGLRRLASLTAAELVRETGLGSVQGLRLAAAFELGLRVHRERLPERPCIPNAEAAARLLIPRYSLRPTEAFGVLCLDSRLRLIAERVVSTGGRSAVSVTPSDVFHAALLDRARSIIAFHNHPSGDPAPSFEDRALTDRLGAAGEAVGVPLLSHVIVGGSQWFELRAQGR